MQSLHDRPVLASFLPQPPSASTDHANLHDETQTHVNDDMPQAVTFVVAGWPASTWDERRAAQNTSGPAVT